MCCKAITEELVTEVAHTKQTRSDLREGSEAPLFELVGTSMYAGQINERPRYRLQDYRGRPVLLVFFSAAFTPT